MKGNLFTILELCFFNYIQLLLLIDDFILNMQVQIKAIK